MGHDDLSVKVLVLAGSYRTGSPNEIVIAMPISSIIPGWRSFTSESHP